MQSPLLSTTYAYDRQQVIYIFDKMHVRVNTQRSGVKNVLFIHLLTDDIISGNWCMLGLPTGSYLVLCVTWLQICVFFTQPNALPRTMIVKPVLVANSIKRASCIKQLCIHFLKKTNKLRCTYN